METSQTTEERKVEKTCEESKTEAEQTNNQTPQP